MSIVRGFRDRLTAWSASTDVDPVTRRPVRSTVPTAVDVPCRVVSRTDRTVLRDPEEPSRVLVDHDVLTGPDVVLELGQPLDLADGRRFVVAGWSAPVTRRGPEVVYRRTPALQVGRP